MTTTFNTPKAPLLSELDFTVRDTRVVVLTPDVAQDYLTASANARPINEKAVNRYVTDLRAGRGVYTADPIKFTPEGEMLDGANRCAAVIHANVPAIVGVATGVPVEARDVLDTGATYLLKHALECREYKRPGPLATALKGVQEYELGYYLTDRNPSRNEITIPGSLDFLEVHPNIEQIASDALGLSKKIIGLSQKQLSQLIWAFDPIDRNSRVHFFKSIEKGFNTGVNDPLFILRNKLIDNAAAHPENKLSSRTVLAITIKAWNLYRDNIESVANLTFTAGGSKGENFPTPK